MLFNFKQAIKTYFIIINLFKSVSLHRRDGRRKIHKTSRFSMHKLICINIDVVKFTVCKIQYANANIKHLYCSTKANRSETGDARSRLASCRERFFSRLRPEDKRKRKCDQISIKFITYNNDYRHFIRAAHKICNLTEKVNSAVTNLPAIVRR